MIEVTEFPDLAQRYQVMGVPLTVVNDTMRFEGGAPEFHFVPALLGLLGLAAPEADTDNESDRASE